MMITLSDTLLDDDEREGLRIPQVKTHQQLQLLEQQQLEQAIYWYLNLPLQPKKIFSESFLCRLHEQLYGSIWNRAGKLRFDTENGAEQSSKAYTALKDLLEEALHWTAERSMSADEIALRFMHQLSNLRCFFRGNDRHARLMADIIVQKIFHKEPFSWGSQLPTHTDLHKIYQEAIKAADHGYLQPLLHFARS